MSVLGGGGFNEVYRLAVELYVQDLGKPQLAGAMASLNAYAQRAQQINTQAQAAVRSLYPATQPSLAAQLASTQRKSLDLLTKPITVPLKFLDEATAPARAAIGAVADFATGIFSKVFSLPALLIEGAAAYAAVFKPLEMASQYEQVQFQISRVTGSTSMATDELTKLQNTAAKTGVSFDTLTDVYGRMRAVKISTDDAAKAITAATGAAAHFGTGEEGIKAFTNALASMQQEAVSGRSGRQLLGLERTYLIPVTSILAKMWGESVLAVQAQMNANTIPVKKAIHDLIEGVYRDYSGDVDAWSMTFKAVTNRLQEVFLWRPLRAWGLGLLQAFEGPMDRVAQFFDQNNPAVKTFDEGLKHLGFTAGDWLVQKLTPLANSLQSLFSSPQFQKADFAGQIDLMMKALIGPDFDTQKTVKNVLDVANAFGTIVVAGASMVVAVGSVLNWLNKLGNWGDQHPAMNELLKMALGAGIGFMVGGPPGAVVGAGAVLAYDTAAATVNNTNPPRGWNAGGPAQFAGGGAGGPGYSTGHGPGGGTPGGTTPSTVTPAPTGASAPPPGTGGVDVWAPFAERAAINAGIDPTWFDAQIRQESGNYAADVVWNKRASAAGARGISQVMPQYFPDAPFNDPAAMLDYSARLMAKYLKDTGGDWNAALAEYNGGGGGLAAYRQGGAAFSRYGEGQTEDYLQKVARIQATIAAQNAGVAGDTNGLTHSAFIPAYPAKADFGGAGGGGVTIYINSIDLGAATGDATAQVNEFLRILSQALDSHADNVPVMGAALSGTP